MRTANKWIGGGLILLCLTSCGSLPIGAITSALGGSSSNDGVQVGTEDITIGKKEEETAVNTQIGDNTESTQTAEQIVNTIENSGLTTFQLILFALLAGWAIPGPNVMFRGLMKFLKTLLPWGWRTKSPEPKAASMRTIDPWR